MPLVRTVPREFTVTIKGKQHILLSGLLALAYPEIHRLKARLISVRDTLTLAAAILMLKDGREVQEAADATPSTVTGNITPHFPRMALTRAPCRVLRDALTGNLVAVEERD